MGTVAPKTHCKVYIYYIYKSMYVISYVGLFLYLCVLLSLVQYELHKPKLKG